METRVTAIIPCRQERRVNRIRRIDDSVQTRHGP